MHRTRIALTALLSALALAAVACAGETTTQAGGDATYNDADITFLQGMIPHHAQAVRMAEMVPERTDTDELRQLADAIIDSQRSEIDLMADLLDDADAEVPPMAGEGMPGPDTDGALHGDGPGGDMPHGDMDGMGTGGMDHEGMLGPDEMRALMQAEGRDFDLLWTDGMIAHHEGAITSAERVLDEGQHPRVAQLARDIIDEQRSEIEQMLAWREQWTAERS